MMDVAHKANLPVKKGGLPNALLAVANAEQLPVELLGLASEITILVSLGIFAAHGIVRTRAISRWDSRRFAR